jgi:hypothetical protein
MQFEKIIQGRPKQTCMQKDDRLLLLQKHLTKKISEIDDDKLIKHYLRQCSQIAQLRLQIRKEGIH